MKKKQKANSMMNVYERPPLKMFTLEQAAKRPGSLEIFNNPSRIDKTLFYPNGTKEVK